MVLHFNNIFLCLFVSLLIKWMHPFWINVFISLKKNLADHKILNDSVYISLCEIMRPLCVWHFERISDWNPHRWPYYVFYTYFRDQLYYRKMNPNLTTSYLFRGHDENVSVIWLQNSKFENRQCQTLLCAVNSLQYM